MASDVVVVNAWVVLCRRQHDVRKGGSIVADDDGGTRLMVLAQLAYR